MTQAGKLALYTRGARSLTSEDIIFAVRKDITKVARLKEFLSWKDLRKSARPGAEDGGASSFLGGNTTNIAGNIASLGVDDDSLLTVDSSSMIEPSELLGGAGGGSLLSSIGGVPDFNKGTSTKGSTGRRRQPRIPWDVPALLVFEATSGECDLLEEEGIDPELQLELSKRLADADRITREMSREEYIEFSECRTASFTFKKAKKFRDWLNPAQYMDFRLNDEQVEILGFLAWEMVRNLTETALLLRSVRKKREGESSENLTNRSLNSNVKKSSIEKYNQINSRLSDDFGSSDRENSEESSCTLFTSPSEKTAILPEDLIEAVSLIERSRNINPYACLSIHPYRNRHLRLY